MWLKSPVVAAAGVGLITQCAATFDDANNIVTITQVDDMGKVRWELVE